MKPIDVKTRAYMDFDVDNNDNDPKYKVDDHVKIPKYKNSLQKAILQIGMKTFYD